MNMKGEDEKDEKNEEDEEDESNLQRGRGEVGG